MEPFKLKIPGLSWITQRAAKWLPNQGSPLRPGITLTPLLGDPTSGTALAMLHYQPGAEAPEHWHRGAEWILMLEGEQSDAQGAYDAGTLVLNPAGTAHQPKSDSGCKLLIFWVRPVEFKSP